MKKPWQNFASMACSGKRQKSSRVVTPPRILFVAESVSLAHLLRPCALAGTLPPGAYDIHLAGGEKYAAFLTDLPWEKHPLNSIAPHVFLDRLARGAPLYTPSELEAYALEDHELLARLKPDLIVSDFRLSLAVAARQAGIPLLSLCNAHWSPLRPRQALPLPDFPLARLLGQNIAERIFNLIWPLAEKVHLRPLNHLRRKYGMAPYVSLHNAYCDGDIALYADAPVLIPLPEQHPQHMFLGPIIWKPEHPDFPAWWDEAAAQPRQRAYVTLGSTGKVDILPQVVAACQAQDITSLVATAGRKGFSSAPPQVYANTFLPGSEAAALSTLVICNGGSATAHQALAQGKPILGICSNMDQLLTMHSISQAGAGLYLRASEVTPKRLSQALSRLLNDPGFAESARKVQAGFAEYDMARRFPAIIAAALNAPAHARSPGNAA